MSTGFDNMSGLVLKRLIFGGLVGKRPDREDSVGSKKQKHHMWAILRRLTIT